MFVNFKLKHHLSLFQFIIFGCFFFTLKIFLTTNNFFPYDQNICVFSLLILYIFLTTNFFTTNLCVNLYMGGGVWKLGQHWSVNICEVLGVIKPCKLQSQGSIGYYSNVLCFSTHICLNLLRLLKHLLILLHEFINFIYSLKAEEKRKQN